MVAAASATQDPLAATASATPAPAMTHTQFRAATTQIVICSGTPIGCCHVTAERRPQRRRPDNSADAAIALQLAASGGWDPAADVNGDGQVTSLDALMILQAAA